MYFKFNLGKFYFDYFKCVSRLCILKFTNQKIKKNEIYWL